MKKYSIAYKLTENGFVRKTIVNASDKDEAIKNLAKQIKSNNFYHDEPQLECELNMDCEMCNEFSKCLKDYKE